MENIKEESIKKLNKAISEYFSENFREKEPFIVKRHDVSLFSGRRMVLYNGKMYWADYNGQKNTYLLKDIDFANLCRLLKGDNLIIEYKQNVSNKNYFDNLFIDKLLALKTLGFDYLYIVYFNRNLDFCKLFFDGEGTYCNYVIKIEFYDDFRVKIHDFVLDSNKKEYDNIYEDGTEIIYCHISLDEMIYKKEEPRFVKVEKGDE